MLENTIKRLDEGIFSSLSQLHFYGLNIEWHSKWIVKRLTFFLRLALIVEILLFFAVSAISKSTLKLKQNCARSLNSHFI